MIPKPSPSQTESYKLSHIAESLQIKLFVVLEMCNSRAYVLLLSEKYMLVVEKASLLFLSNSVGSRLTTVLKLDTSQGGP